MRIIFFLIVLVLLAVIAGGYVGFRYFVTDVMPTMGSVGLVLLAVIAAVATFFSPCAFPLIPAGLGLVSGVEAGARQRKALGAAAGVIVFNVLLAVAIALAGAAFGASLGITSDRPNPYVRIVRGVVGALLVFFAILNLTGRLRIFHVFTHLAQRGSSSGKELSSFGYGFFYTLLGIGCGGPILAGLMTVAITSGGAKTAFWSVVLYAILMAVLMFAVVGLLGGVAQRLKGLGFALAKLQKVAGVVLLLAGVYLIVSTVYLKGFRDLLFP